MRLKSTIVALLIGLSLLSAACGGSGGTATNLSEDDKHKLFQAAGVTQDTALVTQVMQKLGLVGSNGQPTAEFEKFTKAHFEWAMKNASWVMEHRDQAKAREYVKSHMP